ncbi:MAG: LPS-assembly protein LptD [Prevotellaceae bacterium]|nr:LPS-assembly protein LptD [Prevotellaceae bacterium]
MFNSLIDNNIYRTSLLLVCFLLSFSAFSTEANDEKLKDAAITGSTNSTEVQNPISKNDSLPKDSINAKQKKESLNSEVNYSAADSVVFYAGGIAYLYGDAKVDYEEMSLTSNRIRINMDSTLVQARCGVDSTGETIGTPLFKEGSEEYESKSIDYNYKTKKGLIHGVITQQGDGYITSDRAKKMEDNTFLMIDGKYTTCDNHEHPHFYIDLTKAKVRPKEFVVAGPAYLVIADVPLPLFLPFGYFPFTSKYSSGLLMPTYGEESSRGFYLRNGGYYFALSDYYDLALRADIYTKGSWGVNATSRYRKKYKYSGNLFASYQYTTSGEETLPDFSSSKDLKITWTHTQDPKANPFSTFSASVNYSSVQYNKNNLDSYYKPDVFGENNKSSSINYSYRFPETPFSLNANVTANQRQSDSTLALTLPTLYFNMARIYPFKKSERIGKEKWYEKTYFNYNINFSNSITTKQDKLMGSSLANDWQNGVKHQMNFGSSYTIMKYLIVSPSINYNEKWYFRKVIQRWNTDKGAIEDSSVNNFYRINNISANLDFSTQLFGFYKPVPFLFGDKINMIRHVMQPTVGLTWSPYCDRFYPSFGRTGWEYFSYYQRPVPNSNEVDNIKYGYFNRGIFGGASTSRVGSLNFGLTNNVEMKVTSQKDSSGFKKITLIDNLSLNASYNMLADSLKWSDISSSLRLKFTKDLSLTINANFTPYVYQLDAYGNPVQVNVTEFDRNGRIARLTSARTSFGYSFSNDTFRKKEKDTKKEEDSADEDSEMTEKQKAKEKEKSEYDEQGYLKFALPWTFRFDYTISYSDYTFNKRKLEYDKKVTQSLNFSGSFNFSKNWSFSYSSGYDFETKELSYSSIGINRNLHCWSASFSMVPFGAYQSYNFHISVNSSLLQDLKYEKRSNPNDNPAWY